MTAWTPDDLHRIGDTDELQLASRRPDGSLRPFVTMWVVAVDDDLYVRSADRPDRPWYRHALASGDGRIRAAGVERDVRFAGAAPADQPAIDAAYDGKYDRYGASIVGHVTGPDAGEVTVRLTAQTT